MRKYLATLHQRSHHHKKRFALAVSGGFTLVVFGIWTLVTFGDGSMVAKDNQPSFAESYERAQEISPLESLRLNVAGSFESLKETFNALNIYGR